MEDQYPLSNRVIHRTPDDTAQQTYGFTNQEMDGIRRNTGTAPNINGSGGVSVAAHNIDESTCSMALTEIKQTP